MKPHPSEHWVCFACRKQFRKASRWDGTHWAINPKPRHVQGYPCPQCGGAMVNMGKNFRPPRHENKRAWEYWRLLAEHGFRFNTEGEAAFHRWGEGPGSGPDQAQQVIAACQCHTRTEGQRLLRTIARNQQRQRHRGK